ncbi:MAG: alpha-L-arabinofuranosidase C-terminal domain-containing protein [Verrucomicrobiota bacterium]
MKINTRYLVATAASLVVMAGQLTAGEPVKLNTGKVNTPISPYIYGQFIEHLGRCIYGGIWAEILEDRKFYYPITDTYNPWGTDSDKQWNAGEFRFLNGSPWKVIGAPGTVAMDTNKPYVGQQTPLIHCDGKLAGISQEGLSVLKGHKYEGRIILAGDATAAPILVRLVSDKGAVHEQKIAHLTPGFKTYEIEFSVGTNSENTRLEIVSKGKGSFKIGTVSLMPSDNIQGWRRDVIALLKELNSPVYRWPGGNFVSGYNWRDGIGNRDQRPPRKNPAWKGVEHNDVGIHEYMELMALLKTEPYVAVNTGLGTVEEVAAEVEYCNGTTATPMGKLRAKNGHSAPYHIKWWAVGNEMYGKWQLGHMPMAEYVKKHNQVAEAMWKVDPQIKLVGVGAAGDWTKTMFTVCAGHMDLISEHIYCKEKPDVQEHTKQLAKSIQRVATAHREYRNSIPELKGKNIRIAMDEWNFWYGNYIYGELGCRYYHKDGLGVAMGLHEYFRNSDLYFMANYAQTVNVIGCIKTTRSAAAFETTGLVLKLYRQHFGSVPIELSQPTGNLDVSAAWTADFKAITVAVVNPTATAETLALDLTAFNTDKVQQWLIQNSDPQSFNEPGKPPGVIIKESRVKIAKNQVSAPGYSVALYRIPLR